MNRRTFAASLALAALSSPALAAEPLRFAVTDVEGMEMLQQEFGPFEAKLEALTGLEVELYPVGSRTAAVEAMNADQVDMVLTGPAEYVVMKELTDAEIVVGWQRPDYFAQIVTIADRGINDAEDLEGESVAFGSIGSTSQHLGPAQALADLGLDYGSDYEPRIVSRNVAIEALIRGDLAAIGMNFGHLQRAREAYPDVAFQVVARGRDLPNDILVAAPDVDAGTLDAVREAFTAHGADLMAAVTSDTEDNRKYAGGFFLSEIDDADYDYVRSMYRTIGVDSFERFVGD